MYLARACLAKSLSDRKFPVGEICQTQTSHGIAEERAWRAPASDIGNAQDSGRASFDDAALVGKQRSGARNRPRAAVGQEGALVVVVVPVGLLEATCCQC